jgi:hypothetical protein
VDFPEVESSDPEEREGIFSLHENFLELPEGRELQTEVLRELTVDGVRSLLASEYSGLSGYIAFSKKDDKVRGRTALRAHSISFSLSSIISGGHGMSIKKAPPLAGLFSNTT